MSINDLYLNFVDLQTGFREKMVFHFSRQFDRRFRKLRQKITSKENTTVLENNNNFDKTTICPERSSGINDQQSSKTNDQQSSKTNDQQSSKTNDQQSSKTNDQQSSKINDQQSSEINDQQSSKTNDQQSSKTNDQQSSKINDQQSSKTNDQQSSKTNDQQSSKINDQQSLEINDQQSSEINDQQSSKINDQQSSKTNGQQSSEINDQQSSKTNDQQSSKTNDQQSSKTNGQQSSKTNDQQSSEIIDQSSEINGQSSKTTESNEMLERFEEIREETITEFTEYIDNYLGKIMTEFLTDPECKQKIEEVANRKLMAELNRSINEGLIPVKRNFLDRLKGLRELATERRKQRDRQLEMVCEQLSRATTEYDKQHALAIMRMAKIDDCPQRQDSLPSTFEKH